MKEKIKKLRKEGKTYNEISKILGCSKGTISYHLKNSLRDRKILRIYIEGIDEELQDNLINSRISGDTIRLIYDNFSELITFENIVLLFKKNKLSHMDRISDDDISKIREEFKKIGMYKTVAKNLNTTYDTVKKYTKGLDEFRTIKKITKSQPVVEWRRRTKIKLVNYKGGKCEKCGYDKCVDALEFHHKLPNEKDFTISGKSWSFEKLKNEVDKCILVCSNCHKEIHYELKNIKILADVPEWSNGLTL
jgi:DNA-binding Lrp family transcriptional regulator